MNPNRDRAELSGIDGHAAEPANESKSKSSRTNGGPDRGDLRDARSYSGRRLTQLLVAIAALLIVAEYFHVLSTVAVLAAIVLMIILHELGHYLVARMSGMKVREFFVGFGPRIWSFTRHGIEYGIKALPFGGYVKIEGMTNLDEVDPADEARTYRQASFPRRVAVAVAGSAVHFILAFLLLWWLISGIGILAGNRTVITGVLHDSGVVTPAIAAKIQPGDSVVRVDSIRYPSPTRFAKLVGDSIGVPLRMTLENSSGRLKTVTVKPISSATLAKTDPAYDSRSPHGVLGVTISANVLKEPVLSGAGKAISGLASYAELSVVGIVSHFTPSGIETYLSEVAHPSANPTSARSQSRFESPVGIAYLANYAVHSGIRAVVELLFLINVFVGVFNMFPLLPLDGGHVVIAVYERLRSRHGNRYHADVAKLMPLTYAVLAIILFLGVTALYLDLTHPVANPFG
jgi:membrane-associated protease RseP (regulator of RpoE activity)